MSCQSPFLLALLLLTGCTTLNVARHVPLSTMSRLASLKLEDVDPATLRVAARLPLILQPQIGGVKVHLNVAGGSGKQEREFILEPAMERDETAHLANYERPDARLWIYRLAKDDIEAFRQIRSEAEGAAGRNRISISAGVAACHREALESKPLPTTTFLRTNTSGYFILAEDLDIRSIVSEKDLATKVPPCP